MLLAKALKIDEQALNFVEPAFYCHKSMLIQSQHGGD